MPLRRHPQHLPHLLPQRRRRGDRYRIASRTQTPTDFPRPAGAKADGRAAILLLGQGLAGVKEPAGGARRGLVRKTEHHRRGLFVRQPEGLSRVVAPAEHYPGRGESRLRPGLGAPGVIPARVNE